MSSPAQATANRANSQLSTGPSTAAGKQTVSQNAVSHGLCARVHPALLGEHAAFEQYRRAIVEALAPVGAVEEDVAEGIAADRWRLKRAHNMENALFAQIEQEQSGQLETAVAQVQAFTDPAKGLQRVALYTGRIQRAIDKNTAALEAMQASRKAACAQALEEAILLTQLAESKGQTYDPAPDFEPAASHGGFVYSEREIARIMTRTRRLEEAKIRFAPAALAQKAA